MQKIQSQLTLGFRLQDENTFDNFYASKNIEIINQLKLAVRSVNGRQEIKTRTGANNPEVIYLCGVRGQGLSHLLQACCHYAHQHHIRSVYLPFSTLLPLSSEVLNGIETVPFICLDDIHLIANHSDWENALFHLYNRVIDSRGTLIISAHDLPKNLSFKLADLVSRLEWGIIYQLHPLTDLEKVSVLILRAKHRGMTLSAEVGKYILTHCPRHMGTLLAVLDTLDKASLSEQRRLTIPFVKEVLEI